LGSLIEQIRAGLRGRYEVEAEIGRGGMATVFVATDARHERRVAIKVLDPEVGTAAGKERFDREIKLTAGLSHPHILSVIDSGELPGPPVRAWYAMPYIEGDSLRARLDREGQLPVPDAIRIATQVLDALDHAHRKGIVHRDIKPENILLQEGHALIADFGVARLGRPEAGQALTATGMTVGTPSYMSPEQLTAAGSLDHRADIYSVGCVLYEMLCGVTPYAGPSPMAIVAQAMTGDVPAVASQRPSAAALQPVLDRALARLPADRYGTAPEMMSDLEALANRGTAALSPPGSPARHRRYWLLASLLVLLVPAIWWLWPRGAVRPSGNATIAVLPFRPVGGGADEIASGITISVRDRLAVVDGIDVVGETSSGAEELNSLPAPALARRLGADYLLRAVVEKDIAGDRIEVRPELFGANGTRIGFWDQRPIVVDAATLSDVERTIAGDVVSALDLTIGEAARANLAPPQSNPAAYEAYLRAQHLTGEARTARLLEAIALDSTFALAYADLALSAAVQFNFGARTAADSARIGELADAALRHGPELAASFLAEGLYHRTVTQNLDSALYYLDRARALAPGRVGIMHFRASALWSAGFLDSALVEAQRAAGLDPLSASAVSRVSRNLLWQHRLGEAWARHEEARPLGVRERADFVLADGAFIQAAMGSLDSARAAVSTISDPELRGAVAGNLLTSSLQGWLVDDSLALRVCRAPQNAGFVRQWPEDRLIGCALEARSRGDTARARAMADSARSVLRSLVDERPGDELYRMRLAYADFLAGDREAALAQADSSIAIRNAYWDFYPGAVNAICYARLVAMAGDADRAVRELGPMLSGYSPLTVDWLRIDPAFDEIRGRPEFQAVLRTGGLTE